MIRDLMCAALGLILIVSAVACSSGDDGDPDVVIDDSGDTGGGDNGGGDNGGGDNGGGDNGGGDTGATCVDEADFETCANCFASENPDGAAAYDQGLIDHCICANECASECTSACADPSSLEVGDACDTCLNQVVNNQSSACVQGFVGACQAAPACIGFIQQLQSCPQ